MDPIYCEVIHNDSSTVIIGRGVLDLRTGREFNAELIRAAEVASDVVVDLKSSTFIDSAILAALAKAVNVLAHRGKRLKVVVTSETHPLFVLRTVGFDTLVDLEVTES